MEIKYEPVFGDQSLFDGASKLTVAICAVPYSAKNIEVTMTQLIGLDVVNYQRYPVITMRRIIKEPKRWTVADQKAGRLPEVGCKVFDVKNENEVVVKAINTRQVCLESPDGFIYLLHPDDIKPIESPEEKAARLRSEWCNKAAKQLKNLEYSSTLTSIYDALLSGELQAPKDNK